MQALDRSFLVDLGIDHLAPGDEEDLLAEVYSELELRVGQRFGEEMTDEQLEEFEDLIKNGFGAVMRWVFRTRIGPLDCPVYTRLRDSSPDLSPEEVLCEWAQVKWLEVNSPNYPQVVAECLAEIREELRRAIPA